MRIRACVVAVAAIALWSVSAAAGDPAVAREQLKIGYGLAEEGKCEEALPHLLESLRLDPKPITLINLADCEEKLGKLADAMGHWVDARARAQADGLGPIEEEATTRAKALEPRLPRLTIVLAPGTPSDAIVERDGVVLGAPSIGIPLPVDPGPHMIVVKAKGRTDRKIELRLTEGEAERIEVDAGAVAAAVPTPGRRTTKVPVLSPLAYAGFGVAAAGTVLGTVTGIMAIGAGSDAEKACPDRKCDRRALDDIESGRTLGNISTVSFILAGAGAAVGVYGLLWGAPHGQFASTKQPNLDVGVGPASVNLRGRF